MKLIVCSGTDNYQLQLEVQGSLIIWYPEVEDHTRLAKPQADQAKIGYILAENANYDDGTHECLTVVTHSDHVFNAIRVAIMQGKIAHTEVEFRFYQPDKNVIVFQMDKDGRFSEYPPEYCGGFFDQLEAELSLLLTPSRKNEKNE